MGDSYRNSYRNSLKDHIERCKAVGDVRNLIIWDVQEDEAKDASLLSLRMYGSRIYTDEVIIACGANGIYDTLPQGRTAFAKISAILQLRRYWEVD